MFVFAALLGGKEISIGVRDAAGKISNQTRAAHCQRVAVARVATAQEDVLFARSHPDEGQAISE